MTEANPAPGTLVHRDAYRIYLVEAWLDTGGGPRWVQVSASAYTDVRNPGRYSFFNTIGHNSDVTSTPSRISSRDGVSPFSVWSKFGESFAYRDRNDAVALAVRLREFGRWLAAWEGSQPWDLERREERQIVRVVELMHVSTSTVVEASPEMPPAPTPRDEIRNAARAILTEEAGR